MSPRPLKIFLCGDVMTGRGIDQILPHPCDPRLFEPRVRDARTYVDLAEVANGGINRPVGFDYIWGDAIDRLNTWNPDLRIINLETTITTSRDHWPGKDIHYRMHPGNVPALTAAHVDCCVLANNHVLDWGVRGLKETLITLHRAGIKTCGAGGHIEEAAAPAIFDFGVRERVLVFAWGSPSSGVSHEWAATADRPGVNWIPDFTDRTAKQIGNQIEEFRREGDMIIASIHWGGNWGYEIPSEQKEFAHKLIDDVGVHIIHGHSSHHPRAFEVYHGQPVLYGCGDFLNDYEGIKGHEAYRSHLTMMYLLEMDARTKKFLKMRMEPMRIRNMQVQRASPGDAAWLRELFDGFLRDNPDMISPKG